MLANGFTTNGHERCAPPGVHSSPTRVAFVFPAADAPLTGGPRTVLNLVTGVDRSIVHPIFFAGAEGRLAGAVRERGVEVDLVNLPEGFGPGLRKVGAASAVQKLRATRAFWEFERRLSNALRRHRVDLIWTRNIKGVLLCVPAAHKLRLPLLWDIGLEPESRGVVRALHAAGLYVSTRVVTQASSQPQDIFGPRLARLFAHKLTSIPPAVDPRRAEQIMSARRTRPEGDERVVVLSLGTIHPRKNQRLLIEAVSPLMAKMPSLHVQIAGETVDAGYGEELKRLVAEHGLQARIEWLGFRTDVAQIMANSDLFVLSSNAEGVPHVVREAMLAGLPVIATGVGGVRDVVSHGETGLLVAPSDVAALRSALAHIVQSSELRAELGSRARARARERSHDVFCATYSRLLRDLAVGHRTEQHGPSA